MDIRQSAFLNILRSALSSAPLDLSDLTAEDLAALAQLAQQHHVFALFYETVHTVPAAEQALKDMGAVVRRQVMEQVLCTDRLLQLSEQLPRALVVKGIVCRQLYPMPDHRPSSDEDILALDMDACAAALEDQGMVTQDPPDSYERTFRDQRIPFRIELHRQLFDPASAAYGSWNQFFTDVFDRAVEMQVQGQKLLTMAPTDHMLYLLLHAFKHFLHSGFGIRQVCDIALYGKAYAGQLDWQYLEHCLRQVRADKFAAAVLKIGQNRLGIPVQTPWALSVEETPLLEDLLSGGIYGGASDSRKRSSNVTLAAYTHKRSGTLASALFPPVGSLQGRYPYLKKHPWLLPWAWLCRILTYKKTGQTAQTVKIGNQRLTLLRFYGVTEECDGL